MGSIWLIAHADLRRRWRELLLLGLLVALTSGAVMAATVAAVRAETSIERFLDWSRMSSAAFPPGDEPAALIDALKNMPDVEALAVGSTLTVFVPDADGNAVAGESFEIEAPYPIGLEEPEGTLGVDIDRPMIVEGRMPRQDRAGEILLLEWKAEQTGWQLGDRLTAQTLALADLDEIFGGAFPGINGPVVTFEVVGIGRSGPDIAGERGVGGASAAIGTERLAATTKDEALWWPANISIRTSSRADEFDLLPALLAAGVSTEDFDTFGGEFVGGVTDARGAAVQTASDTARTMAVGLGVFAAAVFAVGAIIVGQAVIRHLSGAAHSRQTLSQLGQSRRAIAIIATIPICLATIAGVLAGAAAAIVASAYLPTGLAGRAEVSAGIWVRPDILLPISAAATGFTVGFCFLLALRRTTGATVATGPPSSSTSASSGLARADPPPSIEAGVRLALQRGRPPRALPTRSAFTGLTITVVGAIAAITLVHSVNELTTSPERWGWNWSSTPFYVGDDPDRALDAVAAEAQVDSVGSFVANGVSVNGTPLGGFAIETDSGELGFVVRSGRLPEGPGEVALGERTLQRLDVAIGGTVDLADFEGGNARTVTVVGSAVFPFETAETIDDGAAMLPETLFDTTDEETAQRVLLVRYVDGADPQRIEARLAAEHGLIFDRYSTPTPPAQVRNLSVTNDVAIALGAFLGVLGITAVAHAIIVTGRRRRVDIAVLRSLGFVRRQVRVAFMTQSLVFGVVAVAIGGPIGLVIALLVWRAVTDDIGAVITPSVPWGLVLATVPVVLGIATLLSWWPGRAASRQNPAESLRAE